MQRPRRLTLARSALLVLAAAAALALPGLARAATFVVTTTAASGPGSLHDAIEAANAAANASGQNDLIAFALPAGDSTIRTVGLPEITDAATIDGSTQPHVPVFVGGREVPAVEVLGLRGIGYFGGLSIGGARASGTIIRGLAIGGFAWDIGIGGADGVTIENDYVGIRPDQSGACECGLGVGIGVAHHTTIRNSVLAGTSSAAIVVGDQETTISGNRIGTDASGETVVGSNNSIEVTAPLVPGGDPLRIGGDNATPGESCTGECNVISGNEAIWISSPIPIVITGNYIGTNTAGTKRLGGNTGIFFTESAPAAHVRIGGTTPAQRNVISGRNGGGISVPGAQDVTITGNFIGTDATGTRELANYGGGIGVGARTSGIVIGGASSTPSLCNGACNLISGNSYFAIALGGAGVAVRGNFIGTDVTGTKPLPNANGLRILSSSSGDEISRNRIAYNDGAAIFVGGYVCCIDVDPTANRFTENAIFANRGGGIDLSCPRPPSCSGVVNLNDPGDIDTGANEGQNWPVVTRAEVVGNTTTVTGELDSGAGVYHLEFFRNGPVAGATDTACYPGGYSGQGQEYVGSRALDKPAGVTPYTVIVPFALRADEAITATATDAAGNTSEFSECVADLAVTTTDEPDPVAPGNAVTYTVHVTNRGPAPAPNVVLWDELHEGDLYLYRIVPLPQPSQGTCRQPDANGRWRCDLGSLARGAEATVTMRVTPLDGFTSLTNVAWVTDTYVFDEFGSRPAIDHDPDHSNNRAEQTTTIRMPAPATVVIRKVTTPVGDPTLFGFTGDVQGFASSAQPLSIQVAAGTYLTTESVRGGWDLASITCDDTDSSTDIATRTATFRAAEGETVTCTFTNRQRATVSVHKTVAGAAVPPGMSFTFQLREGASTTNDGTILASAVADASNGGSFDFSNPLASGSDRPYQLCEALPSGWSTSLPNPFAPNGNTNFACSAITTEPAGHLVVSIDNKPPPPPPSVEGIGVRTIGYWKNWSSCAGSRRNQDAVLDRTLARADPAGTPVGVLSLHGGDCIRAVRLLDKSTIDTSRKQAADPAFNLAAQFLAATLNVTAGAPACPDAKQSIAGGQALLAQIRFNGVTHDSLSAEQSVSANVWEKALDRYNNGLLC
jgi:uncharacterized repeat protein (TIGR01451 family)